MRRAAAVAAWIARSFALAAALALGGCATVNNALDAVGVGAPQPPAPPPLLRVDFDAPPELKPLLEQHLDLVRLGHLARADIDDTEWQRLIDAAPAQVRELLQTEGHFKPDVKLERPESAAVRLLVKPGPQATIARFNLEAEGALGRDAAAGDADAQALLAQLRGSWELPVGSAFRNAAWSDAKSATLARLRAAGYATAAWLGTGAEVDVEADTVRLFAVVDSGPLFRFGRLEVEGLERQDEKTVRNLLGAREATPLSEARLLDFQERLQKSGLFESIGVTLDTDPAQANQARVLVKLRESALQVYTFGIGVSANTGPRASVEHLYRRVFGYPASSRLKIEVGKKRQAWDGEISSHALDGLHRNLVGAAVERLASSTDVVLSQRARVGRAQDTQRFERLYFVEAERSRRTTDTSDPNKAFALSLNARGGWRELDSLVLPTQGGSLSVQLGVGRSHGTDAVAGYFQRAYGKLTVYQPLGQSWYGQARVEAGQVFLRSNMVVTESQQWRAGGDDSVRGYGYRSLGPVVDGVVGSGNAIFTSSVELARPFSNALPSVWGAVFVDAGNVADRLGNIRPVVGYGVGVRWRSPVGPLRLDYAYGREVRQSRFHFSVGISF
ncbi:Outer membrane protein assembly factor [Rubrivivax sp. A210]|uniref:autotransporter assembly complex protein TamA n=1 Tax=Rubrivivax sp. A210 TaxID=2772301 RepID=UPI00191949BA|nr:BamA/TamA family outer membrane protein [Rubrivivax sp. A210]CAD5372256.1 Outer membrane protein assembly factor [Rubrivivax sp. A210]